MNSDSNLPPQLDMQTLSAFVDGALPESEQATVRAELERDPQSKARVAAWMSQKTALKALCRELTSDTPSFVVLRARGSRIKRMAIAAGWLVAGVALGATVGSQLPRVLDNTHEPATFAQRADIAYAVYAPEVRHPVEVGAQDEAQLRSWLSKRLGRSLSVPSLQEYGYVLVGGRLLPGEKGPAAQFMYESPHGTRLTLYVAQTPNDEMAFRLLRDGGRRTFYWVTDHLGYALSGPIAESNLRAIAIDVCSSLGGRPESWSRGASDSWQ
jgi:anti-sigma factor RsiW